MRLRAGGSVFSLPAFLPQRGVLLLFRVDELLAGIAMLASGAPIATALLLIRPALAAFPPLLANRPAAAGIVVSNPSGLRRVPQFSAREPLHFRVRVFLLDALKRRQQFLAL